MANMNDLDQIIKLNHNWAQSIKSQDKDFFPSLVKGQSPKCLWIGCCDSRVPPDTICGVAPGSLFVHRNIANQIKSDDESMMATLAFAINKLKLKSIVVCGHTECAGILTALSYDKNKYTNQWLQDLRQNLQGFSELELAQAVEMNVKKQLEVLRGLPLIIEAKVQCSGVVFNLETGLLKQLV